VTIAEEIVLNPAYFARGLPPTDGHGHRDAVDAARTTPGSWFWSVALGGEFR
jgi:hypothetical protein